MRRATIAATLALATAACGTTPASHAAYVGSHELPHPDHRAEASDPTSGLADLLAAAQRPTRVRVTRGTIRPRLAIVPARNSTPGGDDFWHRLSLCESGGQLNPPGYYIGTFQFSPDTAAKLGVHRGDSYATQQAAAEKWSRMVNPASTSGWPVCWRKAS